MSDQPPSTRRPVRRRPNIVAFFATGALLGILIGGFVGLRSDTGDYSQVSAIALWAVIGAIVGALIAGIAIALIEYRSLR